MECRLRWRLRLVVLALSSSRLDRLDRRSPFLSFSSRIPGSSDIQNGSADSHWQRDDRQFVRTWYREVLLSPPWQWFSSLGGRVRPIPFAASPINHAIERREPFTWTLYKPSTKQQRLTETQTPLFPTSATGRIDRRFTSSTGDKFSQRFTRECLSTAQAVTRQNVIAFLPIEPVRLQKNTTRIFEIL